MGIIKAVDLAFEYIRRDEEGNVEGITRAVDGVNLDIKVGDFVAILGHNGSGKSTLAKHLNALLYPTEGTVFVDGKDVKEPENVWDVRQTAGMVFQNPDNQIIGQVVEEDVGFGPENLGVPTKEIWERVEESLKAVGMYEYRKHSPNKLSGGQKQRVAIAGVVAMKPKCIILDEPTAMLDPNGRKEVMETICHKLKCMSSELNVPIIVTSDLNRSPEHREGLEGKIPQIADLRSCSAIENCADSIYLLYRPECYGIRVNGDKDLRGVMNIFIAKKKYNSKQGMVEVGFSYNNGRIYDFNNNLSSI